MPPKAPKSRETAGNKLSELALLPEDRHQRGIFDREVVLHEGALQAVVVSLWNMARTFPKHGSLANLLVILSNEVAKAGAEIEKLREAQRVPSGFALVPLEATRGMINAAIDRPNVPDEEMYIGIYRAMVRAAIAESAQGRDAAVKAPPSQTPTRGKRKNRSGGV
jgi:hypothetical protein